MKKATLDEGAWLLPNKRENKHMPARAESRGGKEVAYGAKKLIFILIFIIMTSIPTFAATDVLFLIDSTGSMSGINNAKAVLDGIIEAIEAESCPDTIMIGVADYRNYVDGGNYQAYGVNLDQPFTGSLETARSVINGLTASGGGDPPESQMKAMVSITDNWLTTTGDLGFHGRDYAQKMIVWFGDAPGHIAGDSPAGYYPTLDAVIETLTGERIIVFALNSADSTHGLNEPYGSPARQQASEITAATGGELFNNVSPSSPEIPDIEDAIVDAIVCYSFTKDDGLMGQCADPNSTITYSLCLTNDSDQTLEDAFIIDWLPDEVSYDFILSLDPLVIDENYNIQEHYYRWELGDIPVGQGACVELEVTVGSSPAPGSLLHNEAELWGTIMVVTDPNDPNTLTPEMCLLAIVEKDTPICCWQDAPEVLYVDQNVAPGGSGLSWNTAFNELQDALGYARSQVCGDVLAIYAAQGTYSPGDNESGSFELPDNIALYGGFPSGGCDFNLRSPKRYETILTGYIDGTHRNTTVVTMGDETLLDGFTVTAASLDGYGIYGYGVDFALENCIIEKNEAYGLYIEEGNASLEWCTVRNNKSDGIYHQGEGFELVVSNCWIRQNMQYGINCINTTPTIFNSIITESDLANEGRSGIQIFDPTYQPILQNLTIAHNKAEGISLAGNTLPNIQNCVIYHNNSGGPQLAGFSADSAAHYCCIQDCNSVNDNISLDPDFVYFDPNNVHIAYNSPCKDSGSLLLDYDGQVDMDSRVRVLGMAADIGAYEVNPDCESDSNVWDSNHDGIVNLYEFNRLAQVWLAHDPNDPAIVDPNNVDHDYLTDPNSPGYVAPSSLAAWYPDGHTFNYITSGDSEYVIDLADLMAFLEDAPWLWKACWLTDGDLTETLTGGSEMLLMSSPSLMMAGTEVISEAAVAEEKSAQEQMLDLAGSIVFLEQIWLEEPDIQQDIDSDVWQEFMDALYQNLADLQTESIQIE